MGMIVSIEAELPLEDGYTFHESDAYGPSGTRSASIEWGTVRLYAMGDDEHNLAALDGLAHILREARSEMAKRITLRAIARKREADRDALEAVGYRAAS